MLTQKEYRVTGRIWLAGIGLLMLSFFLWLLRDAIPALFTTRHAATAYISTDHGGTEAQLQRAFASAKASSHVEDAVLEPLKSPGTWELFVISENPDRAKKQLDTLTKAVTDAFPSAERNLSVSANNSTIAAPDDGSRRVATAIRVVVAVLILGCQLLFVIGARMEGVGVAGMLGALATPFTMFVFPTSGGNRARSMHNTSYTDWGFVLLLLAMTPLPLLIGLWLNRKPRSRRARA